MTKKDALRQLVRFVDRTIRTSPIDDQIKFFEAIAELMPTAEQRRNADRLSQKLIDVRGAQSEFLTDLFVEAGWPGHKHNGDNDKSGN